MFNQIRHALAAPRKLRAAKEFLESWCPKGVEVVVLDKQCWLHYGGMIYSYPYSEIPDPGHVPYMSMHLNNHKWCLQLAQGVYGHRSLLEAWIRNYLPDATIVGYGSGDIIYSDETVDRPVPISGSHSHFSVMHKKNFVFSTKTDKPLAELATDVRTKTDLLIKGEDIYFYPRSFFS